MKILHINSYFNGSSFYKNLFDEQVNMGLDISVYVPVPSPSNLDEGSLCKNIIISANNSKYDRFIFHLKHFKIYRDIIKRVKIEDYSILHAHSLFSNGYIALKLKQKYQIPYIV